MLAPPNSDASSRPDRAKKATYVRLFGLERARGLAAELLAEAEQALAPFGPRAVRLRELARLIVERRA